MANRLPITLSVYDDVDDFFLQVIFLKEKEKIVSSREKLILNTNHLRSFPFHLCSMMCSLHLSKVEAKAPSISLCKFVLPGVLILGGSQLLLVVIADKARARGNT